MLYFKLKQEEEKTGIIYPNSPTQKIIFETVSKLDKIEHEHLMLSLDKTKDIEEVKSFLNNQLFVGMFKMDGLTCSLTYENGELIRAETRGDGKIGENILHNAKVVKNIPLKIPYAERLVIDGEIICQTSDFNSFKDEYKNPRNFAAGSIRLLSSKECEKRKLSFIAWEVIEGLSENKNFYNRMLFIKTLGFNVVPMVVCKDVHFALEILKHSFSEEHEEFPIDGYVFKFNDLNYGKAQGQTDHHLKNAIAYKLYDELYDTKLKTINWTMGRTGILTPVAVFDPIDIDGSTVERASLHNVSVMKETLGDCAYIGEPLKVFKANQIIPQIAEAGPKYDYENVINNGDIPANVFIEQCPICNCEVEYVTSNNGIINAYCSNPFCDGKLINKLDHFFGKKGLDIKGVSKTTFQKLIDWNWISSIKDVFCLKDKKDEWIKKPGFGASSVDKILKAIENGKNTSLDAFISALGIPLIGRVAAKELQKNFKSYEKFREAVSNQSFSFSCLPNFGEEMNNSLKNFDYQEADILINYLIFDKNETQISNRLDDLTIVITGKLLRVANREALIDIIRNNGGKVGSSLTSKTSLLINNDINSTSSKNIKAKELNIPILTEEQFFVKYLFN